MAPSNEGAINYGNIIIKLYPSFQVLFAFEGFHSQLMVQNGLTDSEVFGRNLQQLIIGKELKALLKAHRAAPHRCQRHGYW